MRINSKLAATQNISLNPNPQPSTLNLNSKTPSTGIKDQVAFEASTGSNSHTNPHSGQSKVGNTLPV